MRRCATLLAGLLMFLLVPAHGSAQGCCTVGASSVGGLESGVRPYRTLSATVNYQFNSLTRAHQDRARIEDPLRRTASVGYFNLVVEYGLQPRLSVLGALNYSGKSRELTVRNVAGGFRETAEFKGSGIGDLVLLAKYRLVSPTITSPFEFSVGGGASLPTGSATEEQHGSQLSIDLQPGTGAVTLIGWLYAMQSMPEAGVRLVAMANYRYAGANLDGYRLGDEYILHLGGEFDLTDFFGISLYLKARFAQKDFANRRVLIGTGGTFYDVLPAIHYVDGPSSMRIFGQLPVYRNVRGIQLTLTYMIGVEYTYVFDFRSITDVFDIIR